MNEIPNEKLKKDLWFGVMARMMKNIYNSDILPFFKILINDLKSIEKFGDLDYIYTIISYVFEARKPEDREDFVNMLTTNLTINEVGIMTIADQYRAEGEARAIDKTRTIADQYRAEGRTEGRVAALKEIMGMPENELLALQAELRNKYH